MRASPPLREGVKRELCLFLATLTDKALEGAQAAWKSVG
jgi:hypothetical protein